MEIYYTMEPDNLTVGLIHVVYKDKTTHEILGGWDTIRPWDEAKAVVQKRLPEVADVLGKLCDT